MERIAAIFRASLPKLAQIENINNMLAKNDDLPSASGESRTDDRRLTNDEGIIL